jgi:hypothetical protein
MYLGLGFPDQVRKDKKNQVWKDKTADQVRNHSSVKSRRVKFGKTGECLYCLSGPEPERKRACGRAVQGNSGK